MSPAEAEDIVCNGDPSGIRTRVTAVRGQRTRPLYDGAVADRKQLLRSGRFPREPRKP